MRLLCWPQIVGWNMKQEYETKFKAKVGAWALDENCGIIGASNKFDVPNDLVYEWAKWVALSLTEAFVDDNTPLDEQDDVDENTRSALIRLAAEYGRISKGSS
jgi:hypothetical protein